MRAHALVLCLLVPLGAATKAVGAAAVGFGAKERQAKVAGDASASLEASSHRLSQPRREGEPTPQDDNAWFQRKLAESAKRGQAKLQGVNRNNNGDLRALASAIGVSTLACLVCMGLFLHLKARYPFVFANRLVQESDDYDSELPDPRLFSLGWLSAPTEVPDDKVIEVAGLDGFMLCELFTLGRCIFRVLVVVGFSMYPAHYFLGRSEAFSEVPSQRHQFDVLMRLGIDAMISSWVVPLDKLEPGEKNRNLTLLWAHALVVWYVTLVTLRQLFAAHSRFLAFRFKWLQAMPYPRSNTLLVENIPSEHRSDDALYRYFVAMFTKDAIQSAYIVRRTRKLKRLADEADRLEREVLAAQAREETAASRVARTDVLIAQLAFANRAAETQRQFVEEHVEMGSSKVCSASGFVTFTSRRWCRLASREQLRADKNVFKLSHPPEPRDVHWEDLGRDATLRSWNDFIAWALVIAIFLAWTPLTVTLSALTSLDTLETYVFFRWLKDFFDSNPSLRPILEGALATGLLNLVMSYLPTVLHFVTTRFLTLQSGAMAQVELQNMYWTFLVIFVLLVTAINKTLLHSIGMILDHPKSLVGEVAKLPSASHFYVDYMVFGWSEVAFELLRIMPICRFLFYKHLRMTDLRDLSEPESEDYYGLGARMARATFMLTMGLTFSSSLPIINLGAWVYFTFGGNIYRWLLVYTETKKPDWGGRSWMLALRHIFVSLGIFILLVSCLLAQAPWGGGYPWMLAASAFIPLVIAYARFSLIVWTSLPFEDIASNDFQASRRTRANQKAQAMAFGEYVQKECIPQRVTVHDFVHGMPAKRRSAAKISAGWSRSEEHNEKAEDVFLLDSYDAEVEHREDDVRALACESATALEPRSGLAGDP